MWKSFITAGSVDEALSLLDEHREKARIIAGGTDLIIELERKMRPDVETVIDISRIPGLDQIEIDGDTARLGALVNHNHVVGNDVLRQRAMPLVQACWEVGAPQIRNRGTIAGNLITASPANDTITPLMALGASVVLRSKSGERTVPLSEFYTGVRRTVMQPDEMMIGINVPLMSPDAAGIFIKLGLRKAQAISVVNVCAITKFDHDGKITAADITLGSVAPTIVHATDAEKSLIGKELDESAIETAASLAAQSQKPIDDVRSTADYRSEMIRVLVRRALWAIHERDAGHVPQQPPMLWGKSQARIDAASALPAATHDGQQPIEATVNGKPVSVTTGQHKTLLRWLREDARLPGTKEGCAEGECGACTVFLDGVAVMACMVPAPRAHGADIVTVEGLAVDGQALHPLQQAFIETGAVQCGYCTPGFIMSGAKLLDEFSEPTDEQIQYSISGNLCRCTGYYKIVDAFKRASHMAKEVGKDVS